MSFAKVISEMLNENHQGRGASNRMQGGMIAVVVDNVDPEDRYRVRVSYPWLADQYAKGTTSDGSESVVQSFWARISSMMTGSEMGSVWLPEIDDEVMVIFEEGDFERPVIVGSLWNGENKSPRDISYSPDNESSSVPNKGQDGKNDFRFIRSRTGHHLAFNDKEDGGGISIRSKKSGELYIDDAGGKERVRLYDQNQNQWLEIDVNNKKITLQTDTGDILIKAKEKIRMECKNLEIDAQQNITVDAGKKIAMSAGTSLNMSGKSSVDCDSSGPIKMKGSKINLNP
ncbi:MAG: phage baseplate assembly protein V [Bradymonadales bacterium]|jgi:uncharacterized protein involved in type VI secretion and phage assembly